MAFTVPNSAAANYSSQARLYQADLDILTAAIGGAAVVSGCAVTAQGSPNMTVAVAAGFVRSGGASLTVTAGNVTVTTADATNPRIDLVVVAANGTKTIRTGTAAVSPVAPTLTAGDVALAQVYVPASDTTIDSTQLVDKRVFVGAATVDTSSTVTLVAAVDAPASAIAAADPTYRCDGVNDEVQILAALTLGDVLLSKGTFTLGAQLLVSALSNRTLLGVGPKNTVIVTPASIAEGSSAIMFTGSRTQIGTLTGPIAVGANQVTTAGNYSASIAAGDILQITSADSFNPKRANQNKGEWSRAQAVPTTTTLTLDRPTYDAYTTTIKLWKVTTIKDVEIAELSIRANPSNTARARGLQTLYGENILYENLEVDGTSAGLFKNGLEMNHCIDSVYRNCYTHNCWDSLGTVGTLTGYGMLAGACQSIRFFECRSYLDRHGFETGNGGADTPVNRLIICENCIAEDCTSAGFSTHGQTDLSYYLKCSTLGCGGGFALRGTRWSLIDCNVLGISCELDPGGRDNVSYERPLWIGETVQQGGTGSDYAGIAGTGITIRNFQVDVTGATRFGAYGGTPAGRSVSYIESYEPLVDATIEGGVWKGATWHGIWARGNTNTNVKILGPKMEFANGFSGSVPIWLDTTAGSGNANVDVTIRDVTFEKPKNACVKLTGASSNGADNATGIVIRDCKNRALGTTAKPLVELVSSTFATLLRIVDNHCPNIAKASIFTNSGTVSALHQRGNYGSDGFDTAP